MEPRLAGLAQMRGGRALASARPPPSKFVLECCACIAYLTVVDEKDCAMSETGLQKLAFVLLVILILYVSIAGGV